MFSAKDRLAYLDKTHAEAVAWPASKGGKVCFLSIDLAGQARLVYILMSADKDNALAYSSEVPKRRSVRLVGVALVR